MSERQYPRQVWVLQPSLKPKQITIVAPAHEHSTMFADWDREESGTTHHIDKMHPTLAAAIAAGREQIIKMRTEIEKRKETMNKRIAALDKAEKESK